MVTSRRRRPLSTSIRDGRSHGPLAVGEGYDFSPIFSRDGSKSSSLRSDGPPRRRTRRCSRCWSPTPTALGRRALTPPSRTSSGWIGPRDGTRVAYMARGCLWVVAVAGGDRSGSSAPDTCISRHGCRLTATRSSTASRRASPAIFAIRSGRDRASAGPCPSVPAHQQSSTTRGSTVSPGWSRHLVHQVDGRPESPGALCWILGPGPRASLPAAQRPRVELVACSLPMERRSRSCAGTRMRTYQIVAPADGSEDGRPVGRARRDRPVAISRGQIRGLHPGRNGVDRPLRERRRGDDATSSRSTVHPASTLVRRGFRVRRHAAPRTVGLTETPAAGTRPGRSPVSGSGPISRGRRARRSPRGRRLRAPRRPQDCDR